MANKKFMLVVLVFGFIMSGCVSVKTIDAGRFDSTIKTSDESTLVIGEQGYPTVITRFDNQTVQWNGGIDRSNPYVQTQYVYTIRIPSGAHMLTGVAIGISAIETSARYNFVAGKTYRVAVVNGNVQIAEVAGSTPVK